MYYRKNMAPFNSSVNLDGLIAKIERICEYKQPPQIKFTENIKFPELKGRAGLYVIELIGNGKSSRAIIKIGTLSLVSIPTAVGQICYVLDGERKVCKDDSTSIWMDNQLFKANLSQGGRVVVPYLPSGGNRTIKAILLHQGLAQLVDCTRMEENYRLHCGFLLLPESVISGKTASILVRPELLVNNRVCDLSKLHNIKCVIHTRSFVENITSSKTFSHLEISENKDIILPFIVSSNLKEIDIELTAEIQNISKDKKQYLKSEHRFELKTQHNISTLFDIFLKQNPDLSYELHLRGKNGEPIQKTLVHINISSNICKPFQAQVATNEKGILYK